MTRLLFTNARVFDGTNAECAEGMHVLVAEGRIQEISSKPIATKDARVLDVGGRTLMPGLIDAHTHAFASDVAVQTIEGHGAAYRTAHAVKMLGNALDSGFTTVRDVGGGDYSLSRAIMHGLIRAPRFFYAGKILSMTGGHGDMRPIEQEAGDVSGCACGLVNTFCRLADGIDACIRGAREELRQGAHCIKIMGSGGVASPTDPIWMNQYREDEIRAIVNECKERRSYATAHCHPASAIRRCVEYGVRCIEHGTLIDDETARFVAEKGAYVVPTMAVIFALQKLGRELGFPPQSQEKMDIAFQGALEGMDRMRKAGVKLGLGTDLIGKTYTMETTEFTLRRDVFSGLEILRQATSMNAEILQMGDELGRVAPGAHADLIVVDGDPLADIGLLAADGKNLRAIVRAGEVVKAEL